MMRVGEGFKGGEDEIGVRYFQSKVCGLDPLIPVLSFRLRSRASLELEVIYGINSQMKSWRVTPSAIIAISSKRRQARPSTAISRRYLQTVLIGTNPPWRR
jgi:hypothetical protein